MYFRFDGLIPCVLRMQYLHTTIEQMQEAWEDILLEMDSKLQKFAEEKNVSLRFLRLVPLSGVAAIVINVNSPSSSVIRHLSFKSHHFWVSDHSIHPHCPRASFFFFRVVSCVLSVCRHVPMVVFEHAITTSIVFPFPCLIYSSLRLLLVCTRF